MQIRYAFRVGKNDKNITRVLADNYAQAANIVAKKLYGRLANAVRVWPQSKWSEDFSGYFQAYSVTQITSETRMLGEPFYLLEIGANDASQAIKDAYRIGENYRYIRNKDLTDVAKVE